MSADDTKIPSINELTEVPEKMGDGITWYADLTTLKIYGFSHISNTWFPSYDKGFDKLVISGLFSTGGPFKKTTIENVIAELINKAKQS
jgi:hypothetical protein